MKIFNVVEIFDNGEFITLITKTGSAIHLPKDGKHSIVIEKTTDSISVIISLYEG